MPGDVFRAGRSQGEQALSLTQLLPFTLLPLASAVFRCRGLVCLCTTLQHNGIGAGEVTVLQDSSVSSVFWLTGTRIFATPCSCRDNMAGRLARMGKWHIKTLVEKVKEIYRQGLLNIDVIMILRRTLQKQ